MKIVINIAHRIITSFIMKLLKILSHSFFIVIQVTDILFMFYMFTSQNLIDSDIKRSVLRDFSSLTSSVFLIRISALLFC